MNRFNNVFLAIKKLCGSSGKMEHEDCFETLAKEAEIPLVRLEFYLDTLQDLGLIKYSFDDCVIRLTSFGKQQDRLFAAN
jgi:hypothetical protein